MYAQRHRMKKYYHTTAERVSELLEEQDGLCAICYGVVPASHIDHDHQTGQLRGLLCNSCNRGLGYFHDDPEALRAAADYIERGWSK
jgi:formate dehydrogenase maturation protein FdhE